MLGLIGRKVGMTQVFDERGVLTPVTVIKIEDNVWIGELASILPGVTIGKGSVIGAATVVTNNIPPYSVAVGNPAKIIKK